MAVSGAHGVRALQLPGPAAPSARVVMHNRRRFSVPARRFRRALKAEVAIILSLLSASPLGSRRIQGLFSAEVKGITASPQSVGESFSRQKARLFPSCFKFLLLFCVLLFIFCYVLPDTSESLFENFPFRKNYQTFFSQNRTVYRPPPFLKAKAKATAPSPTTVLPTTTLKPSTVAPTGTPYHQGFPGNYHFIIDNPEVCKNQTPFLALVVPVAPHNLEARNAIRQTWGKERVIQDKVVLTMFMLGITGGDDAEKLKEENLKHNDLIQSDFKDSYLNLTIKTMVIMHWLATRCKSAEYAMKVDSDMFLNIDNLVIMLKKPNIPKTSYLTGMLMWNRPVVRSKNSKWYVPEELYPDPTYPTYTLGMGYVFSNDLPEKYVEMSKQIKPFNIEDAYIGMCMKKLGLKPTSPPDPWQWKAYNSKFDRCSFSKVITFILGSSQQLVNYWTELKKPGPPCT